MGHLLRLLFNIFVWAYSLVGLGYLISVADNWLGKREILPFPPTVMAIFFLGPFAACVVFAEALSVPPFRRIIWVLRQNFAVILPFAGLAFLALAFSISPTAYWKEGAKWIFIVPYSFILLLFAMLIPILPVVRKNFHWFSFAGLVALFVSIFWDSLYPMTFSVEQNRPAGFPGNSNWGALSLVMLCAATVRYQGERSQKFDVVTLLVTATGVFLTLSRSGLVNFSMLLAMFVYFSFFLPGAGSKRHGALVASGLFTLLALGFGLPAIFRQAEITSAPRAHYRIIALMQGKLVDDGSSVERLAAALDAIRLIQAKPLLGHGTGFNRTMEMTPHDLYLKQWVDYGIAGIIVYLLLLAGSFWLFRTRSCRPGMALIAVTAVGGLFSHNILEQRSFLVTLGALSTISLFECRDRLAKARLQQKTNSNIVQLAAFNRGRTKNEVQARFLRPQQTAQSERSESKGAEQAKGSKK